MGEAKLQSLLIAGPGVLALGPDRHMVVRPELLAEIQKGVEDRLGVKASEYLYAAGSVWAGGEIKRLRQAAPEAGVQDLAAMLCQHATALGWGEWRLEAVSEEERGVMVRVTRSPFAEAYGQSDEPVCHLLAGAVAGLTESLFYVPAACTELHCLTQGADDCQFSATGEDVAGQDAWSW